MPTEQFSQAIVRKPGLSIIRGITTADLSTPDFSKAMIQHDAYVDALRYCGLEVTVLDADEDHPDSVFVEDTAIVTDQLAVITRPAPESRQSEIISMGKTIDKMFKDVRKIEAPGTLEGGDVMRIGSRFYIGLSGRTNKEGAQQLIINLEDYGYEACTVKMDELLHLKTGVSTLGDKTILVDPELASEEQFKPYQHIKVESAESYAANCIRVNDFILFAQGYPITKQKLVEAGFKLIELDMSEFRKLDGGLSCLSLRF
ncbi:MAG: arginine deiminase family protein [Proteobacteria bacterium]|nr:arginine deiminase family protein [Pseudomonadota bacterium]